MESPPALSSIYWSQPTPGKSRYRRLTHCQIVCRLDTKPGLPYGLAQGKWKSQASACSPATSPRAAPHKSIPWSPYAMNDVRPVEKLIQLSVSFVQAANRDCR